MRQGCNNNLALKVISTMHWKDASQSLCTLEIPPFHVSSLEGPHRLGPLQRTNHSASLEDCEPGLFAVDLAPPFWGGMDTPGSLHATMLVCNLSSVNPTFSHCLAVPWNDTINCSEWFDRLLAMAASGLASFLCDLARCLG